MGHRRSPDRIEAENRWRHFVERNASVIDRAGLPPGVTAGIGAWDDFLMRGWIGSSSESWGVDQLSREQYASLVELSGNYFAAGYEFYTPALLRAEDQAQLQARFG